MARDYFLFVFLASWGVLQIAAGYSGLRGLLFLRNRKAAIFWGILLVIASFVWFFSQPRNIPDTAGGLDGNKQALLFILGAGSALVFTLLFSSFLNARRGVGKGVVGGEGLDLLRETTYWRALSQQWATKIRRSWVKERR